MSVQILALYNDGARGGFPALVRTFRAGDGPTLRDAVNPLGFGSLATAIAALDGWTGAVRTAQPCITDDNLVATWVRPLELQRHDD